ncbi:sodium:calcium antiporter [Halegenticoccus tardaugens]|uniref:sodium:calcium antiporter n=1 Tax=Halegenticoccus tardaugens TaxID=2071624 RepID=UPI00100A90E4|nr:sodium:calcium antiporter [Halegenticoccus tardaugens]
MSLSVPPVVIGLLLFLVGVALVVGSVETFVEAIAESALGLGVSGFFLTVVLAGADLENAVLGVAAVSEGLPGLALGTVFGEALFILGVGVGLAGVFTAFETDVPRAYLLLMLGAPALLLVLSLDGTLDRLDGVVLTAAYLPLLLVVYGLERRSDARYLAADALDGGTDETFELDLDFDLDVTEPHLDRLRERYEGWFELGVAVLAAVGMAIGSELAVTGARSLLTAFGVTGLAFGATVMSFVASIEEVLLTVEPVRRGAPEIGVGNVVGSMLFFVTANAGIIALIRPIDTSGAVFTVHWPFFLALLTVVGVALARGRVGRTTGAVLLVGYAAYWAANLL